MKILHYLSWLLRALLFIALFLFALKNVDPVTLHLYFDQSWQAPLVLVILAFFALGAALGVTACLSKLFSQRREILAMKRELREHAASETPPAPPAMGA